MIWWGSFPWDWYLVFHGKKKTHVYLLWATLATRWLDLKQNTALPLGRVLRKLINFIHGVCQSSSTATAIELNIVSGVRSIFRESALICTVLPSNAGWLDGSKTRMYHGRLNWGRESHTRSLPHPAIWATSLPWVLLPLHPRLHDNMPCLTLPTERMDAHNTPQSLLVVPALKRTRGYTGEW